MGMAGGRIGVLAQDHDAGLGGGTGLECGKDLCGRGQNLRVPLCKIRRDPGQILHEKGQMPPCLGRDQARKSHAGCVALANACTLAKAAPLSMDWRARATPSRRSAALSAMVRAAAAFNKTASR